MPTMLCKSTDDQYSEQETQRRRDEVAKVLLKTPPKPNWWPTDVRAKAKGKAKRVKSPSARKPKSRVEKR